MRREIVKELLRQTYPVKSGWEMRTIDAGDDDYGYSFDQINGESIVVYVINSHVVLSEHIRDAEILKLTSNEVVRVVLVYKKLLLPPPLTPDGITVLSVQVCEEE